MPRLHSGAAIGRPETTHITLPSIPEVVWQQPQETHVFKIYQKLTSETHKNAHMRELKQKSDVESQTSPMKETLPQVSVSSTEPLPGNQTRSELVPSLNDAKKLNSEIQRNEIDMMTCDAMTVVVREHLQIIIFRVIQFFSETKKDQKLASVV